MIEIKMFYEVCLSGDIAQVLKCITEEENLDWNGGMYGACEGGHMEIINFTAGRRNAIRHINTWGCVGCTSD